jgi:hypothetical protein
VIFFSHNEILPEVCPCGPLFGTRAARQANTRFYVNSRAVAKMASEKSIRRREALTEHEHLVKRSHAPQTNVPAVQHPILLPSYTTFFASPNWRHTAPQKPATGLPTIWEDFSFAFFRPFSKNAIIKNLKNPLRKSECPLQSEALDTKIGSLSSHLAAQLNLRI